MLLKNVLMRITIKCCLSSKRKALKYITNTSFNTQGNTILEYVYSLNKTFRQIRIENHNYIN